MTALDLPRRRAGTFLPALLIVLVPLAVLILASGRSPLTPLTAVGLVAGAGLSLTARARPAAALVATVVLGAVVPYYDGRYVTRGLAITPVAALSLVLLPAALARARSIRLVALDGAVGAYLGVRVVSQLIGYDRGVGAAAGLLLSTALPYVVARLLVQEQTASRLAAAGTVAAAAVLSVFAVAEHSGRANPFFTWITPTFQGGQWARPEGRLGSVRAEASFGHPGAFGLYLAAALALAIALALTAQTQSRRSFALVAVGLIAVALAATLSRGPMLTATVAVAALLVLGGSRIDVRRLVLLAALVVGIAMTTQVVSTISQLRQSSSVSTSREALSAQYRLRILEVVLDPEQFSLLGKPVELAAGETGLSTATNRRTSLKSVDSEYALAFLSSGLLALVGLLAVGALLLRTAALRGLDLVERAWVCGCAAVGLDILTVSLQTQQGELWWFAVAICAGVVQRQRPSVTT